jgi:hypothetical protein
MKFNYIYEIYDKENNFICNRQFQSDCGHIGSIYKGQILQDAARDVYSRAVLESTVSKSFPTNIKIKTMAEKIIGYYHVTLEMRPEFKVKKIV